MHFCIFNVYFYATEAELSDCGRAPMAHKVKTYLLFGNLQKKFADR